MSKINEKVDELLKDAKVIPNFNTVKESAYQQRAPT